ncbi:MAG: glycogen/starch synthase [Bacteroidales bacterium]|nr:glycogen/starch synthase [Bacteroidales bacterium]
MDKELLKPVFIFETSWEVCNKVGGIYAVLSTRAKTLQEYNKDKLLFVGPDIWKERPNPFFKETKSLLAAWKKQASEKDNLKIRVGRWNIPGNPIAVLVDFTPFFEQKDEIYTQFWKDFKVDSLHGYGDYDEACMFAYASAKVMESFYRFQLQEESQVVAHFNEWTTGLGALYLKKQVPTIATLFTTHATSIGRSICGNGKPLYDYLPGYSGDQMARELNMVSKHSLEKIAATEVDCFTTVSDITAKECKQLLRPVDIVTPNGFEDGFVPQGKAFDKKRIEARKALITTAEKLCGCLIDEDVLIVGTAGRFEFKNKGLDVFLDALHRVNQNHKQTKEVLAYVLVPSDVYGVRSDLMERLVEQKVQDTPLYDPFLSHWLNRPEDDAIYRAIHRHHLQNRVTDKVKIVYVPCYLNGNDKVFDKSYYDLLIGMDLTVFPSYYEPWGYTPLESVAFSIPTITTDLSGFGLWAQKITSQKGLTDGFDAVHRSDFNYGEVVDEIVNLINDHVQRGADEVASIRVAARKLADQALWSKFIKRYFEAYDIALNNKNKRLN